MAYTQLITTPCRQDLGHVAVSVVVSSSKARSFRISLSPQIVKAARMQEGSKLVLFGDSANRMLKLVIDEEAGTSARKLSHTTTRYTVQFPAQSLAGYLTGRKMEQTNCPKAKATHEAIEFQLPPERLK